MTWQSNGRRRPKDPVGGLQPLWSKPLEPEIAALAYQLWQARDRPDGTPEDDWFRAEETLNSRTTGSEAR